MASSKSATLNSLNISIVADATDAKRALSEIGKQATTVKTKFDKLTDSAKNANTALKALDKTFKSFQKTKIDDVFNLKSFEQRLSKINTNIRKFKETAEKGGKGLNRELKTALDTSTKLKNKFKKPINLFTVGSSAQRHMNSLQNMLDKLALDRKERDKLIDREWKLVQAQRALLQDKNRSQATLLNTYNRINNNDRDRLDAWKKLFGNQKAPFAVQKSGGTSLWQSSSGAMGKLIAAVNRNTRAVERQTRHVDVGLTGVFATYGERFLKRLFQGVGHLQEKRARVEAWGMTRSQMANWSSQVSGLLRKNQFISKADAESMMMAAASSIGHYDPKIVGQTVQSVTKYSQLERALGYNKSEIDDIAKNYYGVAEARQVANDVAKTLKTFETVFKITTTTAGKITVADVETILRNMGPGAATISDEGLLRLLAYAEQIKIAGRGSSGSTGAGISTVGTNVKMLQLMAMGKPSAKQAKEQLAKLGIMDDDIYEYIGDEVEFKVDDKAKNSAEAKATAAILAGNFEEFAGELFYDLAEKGFSRGGLGQIEGRYVVRGGKSIAQAGAYNKRLAQEDPVRWVSELLPLIKQFTALEKNRQVYYGDKAKGTEGMSVDDFLKTLSQTDVLSATTTFWAKSGLSQRVITALSTFSNEAFLHRSEAMLKTAQHQMSADDLMKYQIADGNVNLAFLRIQKAIENFIQAMEPLGKLVAKFAMYGADVIDWFTRFVEEWSELAKYTGAWLVLKTVFSMMGHFSKTYELFEMAQTKVADATSKANVELAKQIAILSAHGSNSVGGLVGARGRKVRADKTKRRNTGGSTSGPTGTKDRQEGSGLGAWMVGHFPILQPIANGATKVNNAKNAFFNAAKSAIAGVSSAFMGAFNWLGIGVFAVNFAAMLVEMLSEYTDWGKKIKNGWDSVTEYAANHPLALGLRFDAFATMDKKTKAAIEAKQKELEQLDTDIQVYQESEGNVGVEEAKAYPEKLKRRDQLQRELELLQTQNSRAYEGYLNVSEKAKAVYTTPLGKLGVKSDEQHQSKSVEQLIAELSEKTTRYEEIRQLADELGQKYDGDEERYKTEVEPLLKLAESLEPEIASIFEAITSAIKDSDSQEAFVELEKYLELLKSSPDVLAAASEDWATFLTRITKLMMGQDAFKSLKITSQVLYGEKGKTDASNASVVFGFFNALKTAFTGTSEKIAQNQRKFDAEKEESKRTGTGELKRTSKKKEKTGSQKIPDIIDPDKPYGLQKYYDIYQNRIAKHSAPSTQKYEFNTWEEEYEIQKNEFLRYLATGKLKAETKYSDGTFSAPGNYAFIKRPWIGTEEGKLTTEHFDLSQQAKMADGSLITGEEIVNARTLDALLMAFNKNFGTLIKSSEEGLIEANLAYQDAIDSIDAVRAAGAIDSALRAFDAETRRLQEKLKAADPKGSKTKEIERVLQARRDTALAMAGKNLASLEGDRVADRESIQLGLMTPHQSAKWQYSRDVETKQAEFDRGVAELHQRMRTAIQDKGEEERRRIQDEYNERIRSAQESHYAWMQARTEEYWNERNFTTKTHMEELIEQYKDVGAQIKNLQTEMMDGLIEANENWLDGDENAWRDYANNILKVWRNMALKQGYAELFGGITEKSTNMVGDFFNWAFGRETKDKKENAQGSLPSLLGNLGSGVADWFKNTDFSGTFSSAWESLKGAFSGEGNFFSGLADAGSKLFSGLFGGDDEQKEGEKSPVQQVAEALTGQSTDGSSKIINANHVTLINKGSAAGSLLGGDKKQGAEQGFFGGMFEKVKGWFSNLFEGFDMSSITDWFKDLDFSWLTDMFDGIGSWFSSIFSNMGGGAGGGWGQVASAAGSIISSFFKDGGVMTDQGPLPLRMYANGGIARQAQVAVYGEGSTPEAYVPLPDGRSIPVTINGGMQESGMASGGNQVNISISVVNNAESGSTENTSVQESSSSDNTNMKKLANNIKTMVKQEIYNQSRPGGLLYNSR